MVPSSAGEGVIGIRSKGGRIALADLTKATAGCTGEVIEPEIGTSVSVGYDQLGVARKLGPTATTPCFKLAPFMQ